MNSKQKGAIGVAYAIAYFTERGYAVFTPVSDVSRFDLVIEKSGTLSRVEVKTTNRDNGKIDLRTMGGNTSWSGEVKKVSAVDCDIVFLYSIKTGVYRVVEVIDLEGVSTITIK